MTDVEQSVREPESDEVRADTALQSEANQPSADWTRPRRGEMYFWPGHRRLDFLTNAYESKFDVGGATFRSVEWYMWYARAKAWSPRTDLAVLIREAGTKDRAKQLSRRCTSAAAGTEGNWAREKRLKIMAKAVLRKFECSPELSSLLVSTGSSQLLYASRYDACYGIGFMMKAAGARRDEWGKNYLGVMLMLVRKRLVERGVLAVSGSGEAGEEASGEEEAGDGSSGRARLLAGQTTMCSAGLATGIPGSCPRLECMLCGHVSGGAADAVHG
jgi:ribA/ribD-fused uncharacterized protein